MKWRFFSHRKKRWRLVTFLMARDGNYCPVCGNLLDRAIRDGNDALYITFDHIIPRSRGGLTTSKNLRLAHRLCNEARGNDPLPDEDEP